MKVLSIAAIGLLLTLAACQADTGSAETTAAETTDLAKEIQGTWQVYQLNVAINSADGGDSFRSENMNEKSWELAGMQPPHYFFEPDNRFRREYRTLNGQTIEAISGTWALEASTLALTEGDSTVTYQVKYSNGKTAFRAMTDWDNDGTKDDECQYLLRKVSIGTD
ncbi:MAG: lipocalin family protein [Saprospiraceae bacterium]